jgi:uncharacterized protein
MAIPQFSEAINQALKELQQFLAAFYGERLRGLYLYGSYARGDFRSDSDIDVLVVLEGDVNPTREIDRISHRVADICLDYNVLIATFPVSEKWFQERKSPLFENVRREAIAL